MKKKNVRRIQELKKKTATKIMSYLLTTAMIVGVLGLSPLATAEVMAAPEVKNINLNVENSGAYSIAGLTQGQDKSGSKIYYASQGTPIEWHAMSTASEKGQVTTSMTLLADDVVENPTKDVPKKAMRYDSTKEAWNTSELCTWLNTDTTNGFLGNRFTTTEQSAINTYADTGKKIAIPSIEEVGGTSNWFTTDENRTVASVTDTASPNWWWLRSPNNYADLVAYVLIDGDVYSRGIVVYDEVGSARPVFHLNLSSVLFSSACGACKSSSFAATTAAPASGAENYNTWNLTLQDGAGFHAERKTGETGGVEAGTKMNIAVTAIPAGNTNTYTQTSAMLINGDNTVICYGKIKDGAPTADSNIEVTIPSSVPAGAYKLKVFAERVNSVDGDGNVTNLTDYASNMAEIPITVTEARYSYNTPEPVTVNGLTASVSYNCDSPQPKSTNVTATVTLSGTAERAGAHSVTLKSTKGTIDLPIYLYLTENEARIGAAAYAASCSFTVGEEDIEDIKLTHTFAPDTYLMEVTPTSLA